MRKETKKIAICGVMGALALTIMLLGGILPLSTFLAPSLAGILIMPVSIEYGKKSGLLLYFSIGILSFFITADKEMALIFIFFLGYYPLLKALLERIKPRALCWITKFAVFNVAVCAMYFLLLFIFPSAMLLQDLAGGALLIAGLLAMANVTFLIYDFAVARIVGIYCSIWREKLMKMM